MDKSEQSIFEQLKKLVANLREKHSGDPWILEQDFSSIASLTIEESFELADSIEHKSYQEIKDELSDLLFHIALYAQLANEKKLFNLDDIANAAIAKQNRRKLQFNTHENVSGKEALTQWEENKLKERPSKKSTDSLLANVPTTLPSLNRAYKLQSQAAAVGFDWPEFAPVLDKLNEEVQELKTAAVNDNKENILEELGDILFTCVNIARQFAINPDTALRHANHKFLYRFSTMEKLIQQSNLNISELNLEQMDKFWEEAKTICTKKIKNQNKS